MSPQSIDNLDLQTRTEELNDIALLYRHFGDIAFRAVQKNNLQAGFSLGMTRLIKLIKTGKFDAAEFRKDPVNGIRDFLFGYFVERGGNLPNVWSEGNTVYLETKACVHCLTISAEKLAEKCHQDVCTIYCRSFAFGMVQIFSELFPEIVINFYNVSSRRDGIDLDCREAFQILCSKRVENPHN